MLKADIKNYIRLETAAIFFLANHFLKQGMSSVFHGWFHLHVPTSLVRSANRESQNEKFLPTVGWIRDLPLTKQTRLWWTRTENFKMKNYCPQWGLKPGSFTYEANTLSVELLELINIDHLKVTKVYMSFRCKLPVPRGRCNDDLLCIFSYTIWGSTQVLLCLFPGMLWLWHFLYSIGHTSSVKLPYIHFRCVAGIHGECG